MREVWKAIPSYKGYEASSPGRIRSVDRWKQLSNRKCFYRGKMLKLTKRRGKRPYIVVGIGHSNMILAHRLVALAFHGVPAIGHEVCHRNGDYTDNRPSNLRWGTRKSNVADTFAHGRGNNGARNGAAKLTEKIVATIRRDRNTARGVLAKKYGIGKTHIDAIRAGRAWSWL